MFTDGTATNGDGTPPRPGSCGSALRLLSVISRVDVDAVLELDVPKTSVAVKGAVVGRGDVGRLDSISPFGKLADGVGTSPLNNVAPGVGTICPSPPSAANGSARAEPVGYGMACRAGFFLSIPIRSMTTVANPSTTSVPRLSRASATEGVVIPGGCGATVVA